MGPFWATPGNTHSITLALFIFTRFAVSDRRVRPAVSRRVAVARSHLVSIAALVPGRDRPYVTLLAPPADVELPSAHVARRLPLRGWPSSLCRGADLAAGASSSRLAVFMPLMIAAARIYRAPTTR